MDIQMIGAVLVAVIGGLFVARIVIDRETSLERWWRFRVARNLPFGAQRVEVMLLIERIEKDMQRARSEAVRINLQHASDVCKEQLDKLDLATDLLSREMSNDPIVEAARQAKITDFVLELAKRDSEQFPVTGPLVLGDEASQQVGSFSRARNRARC